MNREEEDSNSLPELVSSEEDSDGHSQRIRDRNGRRDQEEVSSDDELPTLEDIVIPETNDQHNRRNRIIIYTDRVTGVRVIGQATPRNILLRSRLITDLSFNTRSP